MEIEPESVELVVTSPPYWTLKRYNEQPGQLGEIEDYDEFLDELDDVWRRALRALVPGGRMVVVVGDVNVSRKAFGRHLVFPLHASIQERCRLMGFDNLAPIIWYKIANARYEMGAGGFYGKPYEPNGVIKNDIEYILLQRKPGGYRKPDLASRLMSILPAEDHAEWFQQIWRLGGASTRDHPAPFPLVLAERLIRMFSFVGDTVLDPFLGTGTTAAAAAAWGRNSVGSEVDPAYFEQCVTRMRGILSASRQPALDLTASREDRDWLMLAALGSASLGYRAVEIRQRRGLEVDNPPDRASCRAVHPRRRPAHRGRCAGGRRTEGEAT